MPSTFQSMTVLSLIGLVDSISYMAIAPSLIFYVLQVGGDKEMYGLIMSIFSFASFCGKPVYGIWVDKAGNKFRTPYIASFVIAIFGGILYFFGNAASSSQTALALIFFGRLFSGLGGANQALGYAYIASVIPQEEQTKTNTILSMMRIIGMATGPATNLLLSQVNFTISIFGGTTCKVDPLNSVGVLLAIGNFFVLMCVVLFLEEPPPKEAKKIPEIVSSGIGAPPPASRRSMWDAMLRVEIVLPILILLVVNSDFQLIETALPPAAADGLNWGPVQTSAVLGSTSIVIFFMMMLTIYLSGKMHDLTMVGIGNILWIFGGLGMYLFWERDASVLAYVLPVVVSCAGFPFIAAANRSNFTKAVANTPALEGSVALMQSILSMAASVAGFVTPGLVATFVIRSSDQVTASRDNRELTPVALYVPISSFLILFGLWYSYRKEQHELGVQAEKEGATEETGLLSGSRPSKERRRSSVVTIEQAFSRRSEVNRRMSAQVMGLTAFDTKQEQELSEQLQHDLDEWQQLAEMDYDDDEEEPN